MIKKFLLFVLMFVSGSSVVQADTTRFTVYNHSKSPIEVEMRGSGSFIVQPLTAHWFSWEHPDPYYANAARCQKSLGEMQCTVAGSLWTRIKYHNCDIKYGDMRNHRIDCK
ncbi:hypothetical protein SAMN04488139_0142 [Pseudidiomarina donghaiensis]|nr:hypothetical protein SAMN04488139_0142 [Pseudidiomarina donghaiensis]